jgi:hypothetical protein
VILAHGDSWLDYPLSDNSLSLRTTDIIAQPETMGNISPVILNISHHGDATTDEMSWPKQERMIEKLAEPGELDGWRQAGRDPVLRRGQRHCRR